jgi:hypothetical protein
MIDDLHDEKIEQSCFYNEVGRGNTSLRNLVLLVELQMNVKSDEVHLQEVQQTSSTL